MARLPHEWTWAILAALLPAASCARGEQRDQDSILAWIDDSAATAQRDASHAATTAGTSPRSCTEAAPPDWEPIPGEQRDSIVGRIVVHRGPLGMSARVRWAISPDSSTLLAVVDPAGVENEPMMNSAVFASERTHVPFERDSLWSIEPSPDWSHVAYSQGTLLGGGPEQQIPPSRWDSVAADWRRGSGNDPRIRSDSLRAHVFPASGMAVVEGVAMGLVTDPLRMTTKFAGYGGWRLRWGCDGADLVLGDPPRRVSDAAPSEGEHRVSVNGGELSNAPLAPATSWVEGPVLDVSTRMPRGRSAPLVVRGRTISERKGRVIVRQRGPDGAETTRDIGPGIPLAATRGGRYVLAIAPRPGAKRHESPEQAIVYRIP